MSSTTKTRLKRGLATATPETRKRVASLGGKASGGNFKNDRARASAAGKLGAAAQPKWAKAKGGRITAALRQRN